MNVVVIVLFCVIPMVAWAATLIAMKGYALTGEKMKEIQAVNACRRDAVAGGMKLEDAMAKWQTIDQLPAEYKGQLTSLYPIFSIAPGTARPGALCLCRTQNVKTAKPD